MQSKGLSRVFSNTTVQGCKMDACDGIVSQLKNSELEEFIAIWYCYCQAVGKLTLCLREDITPSIKVTCCKHNSEKWFRLSGNDLTLLVNPEHHVEV